jgi:hypothetical protein
MARRAAIGSGQALGPALRKLGSNRPAAQPTLGKQLQRQVSAGAITQPQAQQTAQQRQTFEKAFGPQWRTHVFGDRGYVQRTRAALAANPSDQQAQALYQNELNRRAAMLKRAKEKLAGS